jgi:hypothetical protein
MIAAMASPRRGSRSRSGFAPPELRGALGSLLRTTLAQASAVREALERGAREGRARIDDARIEKRRSEALAELGEVVLQLIRRGKLPELEEEPAIADALAAVEELEVRDPRGDRDRGEWVAPESRSRFDRGRRPPVEDAEVDDGTVSSGSWTPPRTAEPRAKVWRPPARGGITFEAPEPSPEAGNADEDDLAGYMHPDDVPPKKP